MDNYCITIYYKYLLVTKCPFTIETNIYSRGKVPKTRVKEVSVSLGGDLNTKKNLNSVVFHSQNAVI